MGSDDYRLQLRDKRALAAAKYLPEKINLLIVAEAPPNASNRYFYFDDIKSSDWLFRGVVEVLLGEAPSRRDKAHYLAELRERGVFLIDLKLDPVDETELEVYVPDLISRCKELQPNRIVLVKATVFDAAYGPLRDAGLPVVNKRVYFPSTGRQADFRRQFAEAVTEPT